RSEFFRPTRDRFALDRELVVREAKSDESVSLGDSGHFENDPARLDHGHPLFHVTLTGTHPGLSGFFRDRLIREDPNPNLTTSFDRAGHSDTGCFQLAGGNASAFRRLETEFTEMKGSTTICTTAHLPFCYLTPLYSFR